ncbi:TolB family protein, partial [candidate division KSB1 bacterium]
MYIIRLFTRYHISFLAVILIAASLGTAAGLAQETAEKRAVTIDDYFNLKRVSDPQISPDGEWIAYTVTEVDYENDKSETRIWMIPAAGGESIPMTAKGYSAGSPRWSPDGKYLSFTAARDGGKNQVWVLNRLGGEAQQLTEVEQGIGGYSWSPGGSRILLSIRDKDPEETEKDEKERPEPWIIDRLQFKRDNIGYLNNLRTHLYVFNMSDKSVVQITSGDRDESQAVWSPDGKRVAFVSNRTDNPDGNSNSDIWIVSAQIPAVSIDPGEMPFGA